MTETKAKASIVLNPQDFDASIFDMDGVVTRTATVHAAAWMQLFDEYLTERQSRGEGGFEPFDSDFDYRLYVDGRPRYDGVAAFLASRGVWIPWGHPDDPSDRDTICGLGNRKDAHFLRRVAREGVRAYEGTVQLIKKLKVIGLKVGVFTASRNAEAILSAAEVVDLFDERVDGILAEQLRLPGKPNPAVLVELTRRLNCSPARTAVFEDAIAGVQAGRAGRFGLVVGVNRGGPSGTLTEEGANIEVSDLSEVVVTK